MGRKSDAETSDVAGDVGEPALVVAGGQVDMYPWQIGDEAL